jgi:hypothetical protein
MIEMKPRRVHNIHVRKGRLFLSVDRKEYRFNLGDISPKLLNAAKKELDIFEISPSGYGIHWPLLDEDISIDSLIKSHGREAATSGF